MNADTTDDMPSIQFEMSLTQYDDMIFMSLYADEMSSITSDKYIELEPFSTTTLLIRIACQMLPPSNMQSMRQ